MRIFTKVDEKGRLVSISYDHTKNGEETFSHELSYVSTREEYKESLGFTMGLENPALDVIYKALDFDLPIKRFVDLYKDIARQVNIES